MADLPGSAHDFLESLVGQQIETLTAGPTLCYGSMATTWSSPPAVHPAARRFRSTASATWPTTPARA